MSKPVTTEWRLLASHVQFSITASFGVNAFFPSLVCVSWVISVVILAKSMILHVYRLLCLEQQVAEFLSEIVSCLGSTATITRLSAETLFFDLERSWCFQSCCSCCSILLFMKMENKSKTWRGGEYTFLRFASSCIFVCLACNLVPFSLLLWTGQSSFFGLLLCCYLLVPLLHWAAKPAAFAFHTYFYHL